MSLRCWLGFHEVEWSVCLRWFQGGRCRRCHKWGYQPKGDML